MRTFNFALLLLLNLVAQGCAHNEPTVAEKAAKLLIIGVEGQSLGEDNAVIPAIRDKGVSGVILFGSNVSSREQTAKLIADMKALRDYPLIVSIDQEGGLVNRLKVANGFRPMPSHLAAAQTNSDEEIRQIAATIAEEVVSIGVNFNFAPCVDVNINPDSPAIGHFGRSFSADASRVAHCAEIYVEEHRRLGVLTSLKHFPGHGSAIDDSHLGLTDISHTWQQCEIDPYKELIDNGLCDAIMVSHLYNSAIDSLYPATLSRPTIEGLLREELGWQGVVVSDDMQMRAISDHYGFDKAVVLGINAGIDLFIVGGNIRREEWDVVDRFVSIVEEAITSGEITMEQLDKAVARVDKLVERLQ